MHHVIPGFDLINHNNLFARIRYRQPLQAVRIEQDEKFYILFFNVKQKSIAKGQFVAIYSNNYIVSSGVID